MAKKDSERMVSPAYFRPPNSPEPCDRCGWSGSGHIADAVWSVEIDDHGTLYFCDHHFRKMKDIFREKGYTVSEWRGSGKR
jgi:hypothetical protein